MLTRPTSPWTLENGTVIRLIHEADFDSIADGTVLFDIMGGSAVKGQDYIDMDTRFGYLAYGVKQDA